MTSQSWLPRALQTRPLGGGEQSPAAHEAQPLLPLWPSMEALVCAFSELTHKRRCRAAGRRGAGGEMPSCPDLGPKPPGWPQGHACLGEGNGHGSRPMTLDTRDALFRAGDKRVAERT